MLRGQEVVAVLARGRAIPSARAHCSKELFGFGAFPGIEGDRPKVASHYLLECLREAEVRKAYVVIRQGKWDIPAYWRNGELVGMELSYLVIEGSSGPPDTIDRANSFVKDKMD